MADIKADDKPLVLIVEDDALIRFCTTDALEDHGYKVVEAATAEDALQVLKARPEVRLLFTDVNMPGKLDGMDLARLAHEQWPNIRLVITSGGHAPARAEIPDDGRFIAKPYHPDQVTDEIDRQLHKS